ncbi:hypothetical protein [Kitasatospora cineracea]|uniref:hypothetical protein n=1 Tax=Kitasatospora cineracea TaxID=88074 RepID=UPI0036779131
MNTWPAAAELVIRAALARDPQPAYIAAALAHANLLRGQPGTAYRALYDAESAGLFLTRRVAAEVCERAAAVDWPAARLTWTAVDEDEPDGLLALYADGEPTEYYTEPVRILASASDVP